MCLRPCRRALRGWQKDQDDRFSLVGSRLQTRKRSEEIEVPGGKREGLAFHPRGKKQMKTR